MKAIREAHPEAEITLFTTLPFLELAKKSGYFDDYYVDVKPKWYQLKAWADLSRWFNTSKFDRVYDLQNNDRTSLYFKLFQTKPEWVGVAKGASHQNASPERVKGHAFEGHKQTLALAGISNIEVDSLTWLGSDISSYRLKTPYVVIVPGSSAKHPEKRWPAEYYGELAKYLYDTYNIYSVLIGTNQEKEPIRKIIELCPDVIDLSGKTDMEHLPALARGAIGAIGNDTGPMHVIGVTNIPVLVLFSSRSDPKRHAPLGEKVSVLQEADLNELKPMVVMDDFVRVLDLEHISS